MGEIDYASALTLGIRSFVCFRLPFWLPPWKEHVPAHLLFQGGWEKQRAEPPRLMMRSGAISDLAAWSRIAQKTQPRSAELQPMHRCINVSDTVTHKRLWGLLCSSSQPVELAIIVTVYFWKTGGLLSGQRANGLSNPGDCYESYCTSIPSSPAVRSPGTPKPPAEDKIVSRAGPLFQCSCNQLSPWWVPFLWIREPWLMHSWKTAKWGGRAGIRTLRCLFQSTCSF